jgi:hypothetical protein
MKKIAVLVLTVLLTFTQYANPCVQPEGKFIYFGIAVNFQAKENDDYIVDAIDMDSRLKNQGYPYEHKLILGKEATKSNILNSLRQVASRVSSQDVLFVHIAAHGLDHNGFLFAPYDYPVHVNSSELINIIGHLPCTVIVLVDTCHSGALVRDWNNEDSVMIITSCRADEYSYGRDFIEVFLESLDKADFNKDGKICTDEIIRYIPDVLVKTTTKQHMVVSKTKVKIPLTKVGG